MTIEFYPTCGTYAPFFKVEEEVCSFLKNKYIDKKFFFNQFKITFEVDESTWGREEAFYIFIIFLS